MNPDPDKPEGWTEAVAAASQLAGEWQLDAEPDWEMVEPETGGTGLQPVQLGPGFPKTVAESTVVPPSPLRIIEAMLFLGGPPLTSAAACSAIRGLTDERFRESVDELAKLYRKQNRPYTVQPREAGWILALRSLYRDLPEKLFGGVKETRLNQPAIDVLSLIAYRQPLPKTDIDAARGSDSGAPLRQLVRLGLVAHQRDAGYVTTARFLNLFGLRSLDDLPVIGPDPPAAIQEPEA